MSQTVTGCVFVHSREARTAVAAALRASGMRRTYLSRAESETTPRYTFTGTGDQCATFLAKLPTHAEGIEVYCD